MTDVRIVVTAVGDMAPVAGIGNPFQIGVVLADGWELGTSDRTYLPGGPALALGGVAERVEVGERRQLLAGHAPQQVALSERSTRSSAAAAESPCSSASWRT